MITDAQFDEIAETAMQIAIYERTTRPADQIVHRVVFYTHEDTKIEAPWLRWRDEREKERMKAALNKSCQYFKPQAVLMVWEVRSLNTDMFRQYFDIEFDLISDTKRFRKEYIRIINMHGGSMAGLPVELWHEALHLTMRGPLVYKNRMCDFRHTDDRFEFEDVKVMDACQELAGVFKPWW